MEELLCLLEERLVQHDNSRRDVQNKLEEACSKFTEEAGSLEEKINEELRLSFGPREERILNLIEKLNNSNGGEEDNNDKNLFIEQAQEELSSELKYEIQYVENADKFVDSYKLKTTKTKIDINNNNDIEDIIKRLRELLDKIHESMIVVQDKLAEITKRRNEAEKLWKATNEELEALFTKEDSRIQEIVTLIKERNDNINIKELALKAKMILLINQKYSIGYDNQGYYYLIVIKEAFLKAIDPGERKISNVVTSFIDEGKISLSFTFFNDDEVKLLKTATDPTFKVAIKMWEKNNQSEEEAKLITKEYTIEEPVCFVETFNPNTVYCAKLRFEHLDLISEWSENVELNTPEFKDLCIWEKYSGYIIENTKYPIDEDNPRIATNTCDDCPCFFIGSAPLPLGKITSWSIKILNSKNNDGESILIGITLPDIASNDINNFAKSLWCFDCHDLSLCSGPPHNYEGKEYGQKKYEDEYVKTGDNVGVMMDTTKGELSFILNGVNLGVAYKGIPLDKPLVPCVFLERKGDSVELDTSEVKENAPASYIPVPSNIVANSDTWDSVTLTWDPVEGAEFYQIEVDGSKSWDATTTNTFTKTGFFEEGEHRFRVRTVVKNNNVSKWSNDIKWETVRIPDFSECAWKKCPEYPGCGKKYSVDGKNLRIATHTCNIPSTIIGNVHLPTNAKISWIIKILESEKNDGNGIYVGVAPYDINQDEKDNYYKCGWYLHCYYSKLYSGPPHNYWQEDFGLFKIHVNCAQKGCLVVVMMDTTNGELSFNMSMAIFGIAYEGIPLDKPLVPCVLLENEGDSVELIIKEKGKDFAVGNMVTLF